MKTSGSPDPVQAAIAAKCGDIVSLKLAWERAARKARSVMNAEETLAECVAAMRSPRNLEGLAEALGSEFEAFFAHLKQLVDESPYRLAAWMEAIELVQARLVRDGRSASPYAIVGYVHCSADFSSGSGQETSLAATVLEMLERYGFEGQEGCSTGKLG